MEIIASVALQDDGKMIAIPCIRPGAQPQEQCIQIIFGQRTRIAQRRGVCCRLDSAFIFIVARWHIQELVDGFYDKEAVRGVVSKEWTVVNLLAFLFIFPFFCSIFLY